MAKAVADRVLDAAWTDVATGNQMIVTSGQPTDRANALALALASVAMTPGLGSGDYTAANGDVSGRKVTMTAKPNVPITASGTADHVCIINSTDLLYVTTATAQALTNGGTVSIPAWKAEIADPT